jgi:hypothetical protein
LSTASDLRDACDAAISALVTNQVSEYDVGGKHYRYHDLETLRKIRAHYAFIAAQEDRSGGISYAKFGSTSSS